MKSPPPKKEPKAISVMVVQAELMQEIARENIALANDTLKLIQGIQQLHERAMRIASPVRAQAAKAKVIPFPLRHPPAK